MAYIYVPFTSPRLCEGHLTFSFNNVNVHWLCCWYVSVEHFLDCTEHEIKIEMQVLGRMTLPTLAVHNVMSWYILYEACSLVFLQLGN